MGLKSSTDQAGLESVKQTEQEFGLGLLASTLAHEIRNPLQAIRLSVESAQRGSSMMAALKTISENISRIEGVIDRVQRINEKFKVHRERVHLKDLIDSSLASVQFWLTAAGINVRTSVHWEGEPYVMADRELLQQVLLNLYMNAIQAMPDGGILTITISEAVDRALIEVADTGVGIPHDTLKLLGTPFFTTKENGSGLGLAFCKTIASLHGGSLEFESKEGEGTAVTLSISTADSSSEEVGNA